MENKLVLNCVQAHFSVISYTQARSISCLDEVYWPKVGQEWTPPGRKQGVCAFQSHKDVCVLSLGHWQ